MEWITAIWQPAQPEPGRILVAGCGTGVEALLLAKHFPHSEIVAVDFSPRSIAIAKDLQESAPKRRHIRFVVGDLTDQRFAKNVGHDFDFISCHGVLSYVSTPGRALRNLSRTLKRDGALYLGVNGSQHFSERWRKLLPAFGFDIAELSDGRYLRDLLKLCDAIVGNRDLQIANKPASYLAGDLFGPGIRNLSLAEWLRIAHAGGLHLQGSFNHWRAVRPSLEENVCRLLIPRSRAQVCELVETLCPASFHRLLFTRERGVNPPWEKHDALLGWRPNRTRLYACRLPRARALWQTARKLTLKSVAANTRLDCQMPEWELEILRQSNGKESLREILKRIPAAVSRGRLQRHLYVLYQLMVINLLPPNVYF
jgi:SAM-dependent methyltransferase